MEPIQIVQHESGTESDRSPFVEVMVDMGRFATEFTPRREKMAVVVKIVHPNFESVFDQLISKVARNAVTSFRHEVEGRAQS